MPSFGKAGTLAMWRAGGVTFTRYETTDIAARLHGRTLVVTGRLLRTRDFCGRSAIQHWTFTKVYSREHQRWRVVAFHASERWTGTERAGANTQWRHSAE